MTDDYTALLRGVLIDPGDDLVRLVLADCIEESGDGDRAEFIRWCVRNPDLEGGRTLQPHIHLTERWRFNATIPGMKPNWYLYRRGFVSEIRPPLVDFLTHAEELFRSHPIERVVLTDREPHGAGWMWFDGGAGSELYWEISHWLPTCIHEVLPGGSPLAGGYHNHRQYPSVNAANAALSAACVAYGRSRAGLPPMPVAMPASVGESAISESNDRSSGHRS